MFFGRRPVLPGTGVTHGTLCPYEAARRRCIRTFEVNTRSPIKGKNTSRAWPSQGGKCKPGAVKCNFNITLASSFSRRYIIEYIFRCAHEGGQLFSGSRCCETPDAISLSSRGFDAQQRTDVRLDQGPAVRFICGFHHFTCTSLTAVENQILIWVSLPPAMFSSIHPLQVICDCCSPAVLYLWLYWPKPFLVILLL